MPDPTPNSDRLTVSVHRRISEIPEAEWDACACPEARDGGRPNDPFTTHRFLRALEESESVGGMSGWDPVHIIVRRMGQVAAVMPLYAKHHSQGEYVFDHGWANAFSQAGGDYYPKLQATVPFTPATGRRFLTRPNLDHEGFRALASSAVELLSQNGLSSLHVTFCTEEEAETGRRAGFLHRTGEQFHWMNDGYSGFRGIPAGAVLQETKEHQAGAKPRQRLWGNHQAPVRTGDPARSLGRVLGILPGHRLKEVGHPIPDPAVLRGDP